MPQMKPFHWMLMLMFTTYLLILLSSLTYYSYYPFKNQFNKKLPSFHQPFILWNWKW